MHATHRFFFTKRSLYLLVLEAGKDENESNLHYWLKMIQSYAEDAPVVVVINKSELPNHRGLNETRLKKDYAPNVCDFFNVSCATAMGIPELRAVIQQQIHTLPHVFDEFPPKYFAVKEALEAKVPRADFIDLTDYEQLCQDQGMIERRDQDSLLRFLHELANVLNFHDPASPYKLQETKVINPEWVTAGVYALLNSPTLKSAWGVARMREGG